MAPISSERTVLLTGLGTFPLQYMIRVCWLRLKREHTCPMHGPHAFASTKAPTPSSAEVNPSLSMVARICSEPGVHRNGTYHTAKTLLSVPTCLHHRCPSLVIEEQRHAFACRPAAFACLARSAARVWIKRVIRISPNSGAIETQRDLPCLRTSC
jgi:hypothetical protein